MDLLDTAEELKMIRERLRDANKQLRFRAEVATPSNLRDLLTLGCKMLHYSGHGHPAYLAFENDFGAKAHCGLMQALKVGELKRLFAAGGVRTEVVFVSACHSQSAGQAFVEAGVPHVVAVKCQERVADSAARLFARNFYYALLVGGYTVQNAFTVASTAVLSQPDRSENSTDCAKFLLLPEDGDHNVAVFAGLPGGRFVDETRPLPLLVNVPSGRGDALVGTSLVLQQLVCLMADPATSRCVTVVGAPGQGKTELAIRACRYMQERRHFDSIRFADLSGLGPAHASSQADLCQQIGEALGAANTVRNSLALGGALLQAGTSASASPESCPEEGKVLLVLDGVSSLFHQEGTPASPPGSPRGCHQRDVTVSLLNALLKQRSWLHLLITADEQGLLSDTHERLECAQEKLVYLGPLQDVDAAQLLEKLSPRPIFLSEIGCPKNTPRPQALHRLSEHPVLKIVGGHPGTLVRLAPELEKCDLNSLQALAGQLVSHCRQPAALRRRTSRGSLHTHHQAAPPPPGSGQGETPPVLSRGVSSFNVEGPSLALPSPAGVHMTELQRSAWQAATAAGVTDQGCRIAWVHAVDRTARPPGQEGPPAVNAGGINCYEASWEALAEALQRHLCGTTTVRSSSSNPTEGGAAHGTQAAQLHGYASVTASAPRGMTDEDLSFVRERLQACCSGPKAGAPLPAPSVSLENFRLFCQWWSPLLVTLSRLRAEWACLNPVLIHGFVNRGRAEDWLRAREAGTFLLRFSETNPGRLAVSFVERMSRPPTSPADPLAPPTPPMTSAAGRAAPTFVQNCLIEVLGNGCVLSSQGGHRRYRDLRELINDCRKLVAVYPNSPKAGAFRQVGQSGQTQYSSVGEPNMDARPPGSTAQVPPTTWGP